MATTTNYGWTTPDDTALVKDGASAIRTLGSSVDTTTKALNPETTLGDIAYRSSTANVKTRLGIGTTGQVLAVSGGVPAWTTPASAAPTSAVASVATNQSTTSATYTDLTTSGPAVTITTGTKALVIISAQMQNDTGARGAAMSFAVSGATTTAADDEFSIINRIDADGGVGRIFNQGSAAYSVTLTAGSNVFTAKYRNVNGSTASFQRRQIVVIDLGS